MKALQNEANPFRKRALENWLTSVKEWSNNDTAATAAASVDESEGDDASWESPHDDHENTEEDDEAEFWDIPSDELVIHNMVCQAQQWLAFFMSHNSLQASAANKLFVV